MAPRERLSRSERIIWSSMHPANLHTAPAHMSKDSLIAEAMERLACLDFSGVRAKLADAADGPGWDAALLDRAQQEYQRFLALTYAYPERTIVPDRITDLFWHQHILDTRAYARDTVFVFGSFLHHFPYLGTRGEEDRQQLTRACAATTAAYERHFGPRASAKAGGTNCGNCSNCSRCSSILPPSA